MAINRVFLTDADEEVYDIFPEIPNLEELRFDEPLEVGLVKFDSMLSTLRSYTRRGNDTACRLYRRVLCIRRAFESEHHNYIHSAGEQHADCATLNGEAEARYRQAMALRVVDWKGPATRRVPRLRAILIRLNAEAHRQSA